MGLFSPYVYKSKSGQKFLYYFSKDMANSLNNLPKGFQVIENETTGMPMLRKKAGGLFSMIGKKSEKK